MLKIRVSRNDGHITIESKGHAPREVCAAASMMQVACMLGLRDLAKQWPEHIDFEVRSPSNLPDEYFIDSPDLRLMKPKDRREYRR